MGWNVLGELDCPQRQTGKPRYPGHVMHIAFWVPAVGNGTVPLPPRLPSLCGIPGVVARARYDASVALPACAPGDGSRRENGMAAEGEKEGDARRRGEPPELRHAPPCRRAARSTSAAAAAPASARLEKGRARAAGGGAPSRPRSPAERFAAASALDSPPPVGLSSDSPFASSSMALLLAGSAAAGKRSGWWGRGTARGGEGRRDAEYGRRKAAREVGQCAGRAEEGRRGQLGRRHRRGVGRHPPRAVALRRRRRPALGRRRRRVGKAVEDPATFVRSSASGAAGPPASSWTGKRGREGRRDAWAAEERGSASSAPAPSPSGSSASWRGKAGLPLPAGPPCSAAGGQEARRMRPCLSASGRPPWLPPARLGLPPTARGRGRASAGRPRMPPPTRCCRAVMLPGGAAATAARMCCCCRRKRKSESASRPLS
jgi:hypothetical protein